MDNLLAILGVGVATIAVTLIVAVFTSERTRRRGIVSTVWREVSTTAKRKNPYRG